MSKRAAIYARISQKEPGVDKVENQIDEMRKYAETRGFEVAEVFSDDDISAYKGLKERPKFSELVERLEAREFDVVLATEQSRFYRNSPKDLQRLVNAAATGGAVILTRTEGEFDPSNAGSKFMMQLMDAFGGYESDVRVERQKARNRADLAAGLPTKGSRPFGWEKDRITLRESEALHIRNAYRAILDDGVTVWEIAQRWNAEGLKTDAMTRPRRHRIDKVIATPKAVWTTTTVRMVLKRPRNAGILVAGDAEMEKSQIQPIVSRSDHDSLLQAIKGVNSILGPKPQYLLGGILECICGERMTASKSQSGRPGKKHDYKIYRCRLYGFDKSQKHSTIQLHLADAAVRDWVVEDLGLGIRASKSVTAGELRLLAKEYVKLQQREKQALSLLLEGVGSKSYLRGQVKDIETRMSEIDTRREEIYAASGHTKEIHDFIRDMSKLKSVLTPDKKVDEVFARGFAAWDALPMATKRAIIRSGYRVQLKAASRMLRGIERVSVVNRDAEPLVS